GLAVLATQPGSWLLGPGLAALVGVGAVALGVRLRRRRAPGWAYAVVGAAALGYGLAFAWLRAARLERPHLPEYGVAALLARRAPAEHAGTCELRRGGGARLGDRLWRRAPAGGRSGSPLRSPRRGDERPRCRPRDRGPGRRARRGAGRSVTRPSNRWRW